MRHATRKGKKVRGRPVRTVGALDAPRDGSAAVGLGENKLGAVGDRCHMATIHPPPVQRHADATHTCRRHTRPPVCPAASAASATSLSYRSDGMRECAAAHKHALHKSVVPVRLWCHSRRACCASVRERAHAPSKRSSDGYSGYSGYSGTHVPSKRSSDGWSSSRLLASLRCILTCTASASMPLRLNAHLRRSVAQMLTLSCT
jgi:hypothetical protein